MAAEEAARLKVVLRRNFLLVVFLIYPSICNASFEILTSCREICSYKDSDPSAPGECHSYLPADYSLVCDTSEHKAYRTFAAVVAALVGAGLPAVVGMFIFVNRKDFALFVREPGRWRSNYNSSSAKRKVILFRRTLTWSFLFESYPGFIYWDFFDMIRKFLIT